MEDPFTDVPNSFYDAVYETGKRGDIPMPPKELLDSLSSVSALYLYANPPPMGYGTPAPKVAETVLRAKNFNLKEENKVIQVDKFEIDHPVWENKGTFPFSQVHSNWHPGVFHRMCKRFLMEHFEKIKNISIGVIDKFLVTNSDILTKGRQTWDPILCASVPSAHAYMNMCDLMVMNGLPKSHTLIEFLKGIMELMNKKELHTKVRKLGLEMKKRRHKGRTVTTYLKRYSYLKKTLTGNDVFYYVLDLMRSFCSYIKHGERAHLKRRAIASPSMGLRGFFLVCEEFHLLLSKEIPGGTISQGGEDKKIKIISTMNTASVDSSSKVLLQSTQDATKWNECLSASAFGMMMKTFFDDDIREELGVAAMTPNERLFYLINMTSHFILSIKRITLGKGMQGTSEDFHGEITFKRENLPKFNERTKGWLAEALPLIDDEGYMFASGGMLMGMYNAASTTLGLISVGYLKPANTNIYTLRSSDDSMTLYSAPDLEHMALLIDRENLNLLLCGINLSVKKTFIFRAGYGEYTSWYQDGKMVAQYGPETTTLRPGGNNPPDDFYGIAKTTSVSQVKLETNIVGAEVRIRLGVMNVRSLYRIKKKTRSAQGISDAVLLLSDGGPNPWNCSNCHLEETSLKETFAVTQADRDYLLRVRNPDNPFNGDPKEEITWSKEMGTLTMDYVDTPRTVFHFVRRANRAVTNIKGKTHADSEKAHSEALKILTLSDVSLLIKAPTSSVTMAQHVISNLHSMAASIGLDEAELEGMRKAIRILEQGAENDESRDISNLVDLME
uniref:RNA-directed RNA polymerase catalytic subunit n=1 Tax=Shuangao Insect Virus 4 TaxID=1608078 RepID=A0A0B5KXB2_9ORTO|nr:PB1 [Shuangao Insect Virus 4]